jgi:methionine-rich copper-binding protein CopC
VIKRSSFIHIRNLFTFIAVIGGLLILPKGNAHAVLKESIPAANSTVAGPKVTIQLKFNERIDGAHSSLALFDGSVSKPVQANEEGQGVIGGTAEGVQPGTYRIQWQVLAVDGHITRGEVPFSVR